MDVTGFEPATPCLQSYFKNTKWLARLVFTFVVAFDSRCCLADFVPRLFPSCRTHLERGRKQEDWTRIGRIAEPSLQDCRFIQHTGILTNDTPKSE